MQMVQQISPRAIEWLVSYTRRYGDNVHTPEGDSLRKLLLAEYEAWRLAKDAKK